MNQIAGLRRPARVLFATLLIASLLAHAPAALAQAGAAAPAGKARAAAKPIQAPAKPAPTKGPVAAKNVAVGAAALPALPKALLSHGCLDAVHGEWLLSELGDEVAELRERAQGAPFEAAPAAGALNCVPFAAVRTPANRIESLVFVPTLAASEAGELHRAMVVSRVDLASAVRTSWHEVADAPPGHREVWVPAAGLMAGEALTEGADQVPARWQREVSLLLRQMRKQAQAGEPAWVRLVLQGQGGESARLVAVELVDETGYAIDSAIWLERSDAPGGFVSARGGNLERLLWQSPVDYRRISRGVGSATVIVRRRVFAKPKTPGGPPRLVVRSFRSRGQHQGIDFAAPSGTPVVTVSDGTVVHAGTSGGYGNLVVVDHGGGITTYYAHLSAYGAGVQEGARVERGQEIGSVGSTGMSTGPHLHYEIRKDGRYLDPADPAQSLPNWGLAAGEHQAVLTRLLALSLARGPAFAKASSQPPALATTAAVRVIWPQATAADWAPPAPGR